MALDQKTLEAGLLEFLHSRGAQYDTLSETTDLLHSGLLDSLLLVDLIFHIEETWRLRLDGEHVNPSDFRTVASIANVISSQLNGSSSKS